METIILGFRLEDGKELKITFFFAVWGLRFRV